jgi:hypothetical protein
MRCMVNESIYFVSHPCVCPLNCCTRLFCGISLSFVLCRGVMSLKISLLIYHSQWQPPWRAPHALRHTRPLPWPRHIHLPPLLRLAAPSQPRQHNSPRHNTPLSPRGLRQSKRPGALRVPFRAPPIHLRRRKCRHRRNRDRDPVGPAAAAVPRPRQTPTFHRPCAPDPDPPRAGRPTPVPRARG